MRALCRSRSTNVSFSKVTVALWELSGSLEAGVTESEVIFPLLLSGTHAWRGCLRGDIPETEEIPYFLFSRLRSNVLDLQGTRLAS